jgi:cobalt-zinc-cadmium efflux system protein
MPNGCSHHLHASSRSQQSALSIALALTTLFTFVEFIGGYLTNSLAFIADAGHMLTDVAALGLSIFAIWFSSRPATAAKTYGFLRVEILAALINGSALLLISLVIFYESYHRLLTPPVVESGTMLAIAFAGFVVNLICAFFLHNSQHTSLNLRGALLHVIGDAVSSVGAILAGILMLWKQWYLADPLASFLVGGLILVGSWSLVRDSVNILLEGTPAHIDLTVVRGELSKVRGVASIHDLHVWTLTSGIHAMSCHAVLSGTEDRHKVLEELSHIVRSRFKIDHTTIQLEEFSLRHTEMSSCH